MNRDTTHIDNTDWWNALPDAIRNDIEDAIKQAENGQVFTHVEVKKKYPEWFTKDKSL
jgi:hypothetical protein